MPPSIRSFDLRNLVRCILVVAAKAKNRTGTGRCQTVQTVFEAGSEAPGRQP